jgi:hypothetical protein
MAEIFFQIHHQYIVTESIFALKRHETLNSLFGKLVLAIIIPPVLSEKPVAELYWLLDDKNWLLVAGN